MDVGSAAFRPRRQPAPAGPLHQIRRGPLQELAGLLNDAELSQAAPTSLAKRFFDSLVRPVPINNGRRKRFLDSLVPARSIYNASGKRFYDSLVRPSSFFNRPLVEWPERDLVRMERLGADLNLTRSRF
uniref:Uncharacterized protein n=1 Tax=Macrostomum lignano TaxID=282301 RepID=A0A1I8IY25_9PLAT